MSQDGFLPQSRPDTGNTPFNALSFIVNQLLGQVNVATLVEVTAVHISSRTGVVGTVDVRPLVEQTDGAGNAVPHDVVYGVPFFRLQGGANAVIVDPRIGDVGFCVVADQDISLVKKSHGENLPGSRRRFNLADGIYVGGWVNTEPTSYVLIDDTSIEILSAAAVNITAPLTTINGPLHVTGTVTGDSTAAFTGDVTGEGTSLHTHVHSGVSSGGSNSGPPV